MKWVVGTMVYDDEIIYNEPTAIIMVAPTTRTTIIIITGITEPWYYGVPNIYTYIYIGTAVGS